MSAAARLLNGSTLAGIIEGYQSLEWTRPYLTPGTLRLEIAGALVSAYGIAVGLLIEPPGEPGLVYLIEQIERGEGDRDTLTVSGRDYGGWLLERDCVPPAGQMHDTRTNVAPETAMKGYVNANAGPGAPVIRRAPGLAIAPDQGRPAGVTGTYQARYQYVGEMLAEIATPAGLGWDVRLDYATGNLVFDVIAGVDRATGAVGDRVYFDVAFDTVASQRWLTGNLGRKTVARVLGQGEGAARTVVVTWLGAATGTPEPAGAARRELVIDARDLTTTADLTRRGQAKLAETQEGDSFATDINPHGSFRYREHFDLGDVVIVRNRGWGIEQAARIVNVRATMRPDRGATPTIEVELGRGWPTIAGALRGRALGTGTART